MSKPDIWMPLYVGSYIQDTAHLSTEEHGAYLLLLMQCWSNGGHLPDDDERLRRITRMDKAPWNRSKGVLREFFTVDTEVNKLRHGRVDIELERAGANIEQRRAAGKASAAKRNSGRKDNERTNETGNENPTTVATLVGTDDATEAPTNQATNPATEPQRDGNSVPLPLPKNSGNSSSSKISSTAREGNETATAAGPPFGSSGRIGKACQLFRRLSVRAAPGVFDADGWNEILDEFDDEYITIVVQQRQMQNPGKTFSAAYFLPVLQEISAERKRGKSTQKNGGRIGTSEQIIGELTGTN